MSRVPTHLVNSDLTLLLLSSTSHGIHLHFRSSAIAISLSRIPFHHRKARAHLPFLGFSLNHTFPLWFAPPCYFKTQLAPLYFHVCPHSPFNTLICSLMMLFVCFSLQEFCKLQREVIVLPISFSRVAVVYHYPSGKH